MCVLMIYLFFDGNLPGKCIPDMSRFSGISDMQVGNLKSSSFLAPATEGNIHFNKYLKKSVSLDHLVLAIPIPTINKM